MAERLLMQMSGKFKPTFYKDGYLSKLRKAINAKVGSKKSKRPIQQTKINKAQTIDIMDLLANSLKKNRRNTNKPKRA